MAEAAPASDAHYAYCEALLRERDRDLWLACLFTPQPARRRPFRLFLQQRQQHPPRRLLLRCAHQVRHRQTNPTGRRRSHPPDSPTYSPNPYRSTSNEILMKVILISIFIFLAQFSFSQNSDSTFVYKDKSISPVSFLNPLSYLSFPFPRQCFFRWFVGSFRKSWRLQK